MYFSCIGFSKRMCVPYTLSGRCANFPAPFFVCLGSQCSLWWTIFKTSAWPTRKKMTKPYRILKMSQPKNFSEFLLLTFNIVKLKNVKKRIFKKRDCGLIANIFLPGKSRLELPLHLPFLIRKKTAKIWNCKPTDSTDCKILSAKRQRFTTNALNPRDLSI